VKKKIEEAGRKANLMQFNLRDRANCEKAVEGHMKAFGKLNVLVNNGESSRLPSMEYANISDSRYAGDVPRHYRD
jgi:NADP-dependent 3-hydroxy acid dehydrogenase YdfG